MAKRGRKKEEVVRDKPYLVKCFKEEKDFIDEVARRHGFVPTTFMRDAALEKAKRLHNKSRKDYIKEALEELKEMEDDTN